MEMGPPGASRVDTEWTSLPAKTPHQAASIVGDGEAPAPPTQTGRSLSCLGGCEADASSVGEREAATGLCSTALLLLEMRKKDLAAVAARVAAPLGVLVEFAEGVNHPRGRRAAATLLWIDHVPDRMLTDCCSGIGILRPHHQHRASCGQDAVQLSRHGDPGKGRPQRE
jgi:hypothetical protein